VTPSPITAAVRAFAEEFAKAADADGHYRLAAWARTRAAQFTPALGEDDAVLAEREVCAKIADAQAARLITDLPVMVCEKIAIDIRKRSRTPTAGTEESK
jgi:hypothetical protein